MIADLFGCIVFSGEQHGDRVVDEVPPDIGADGLFFLITTAVYSIAETGQQSALLRSVTAAAGAHAERVQGCADLVGPFHADCF